MTFSVRFVQRIERAHYSRGTKNKEMIIFLFVFVPVINRQTCKENGAYKVHNYVHTIKDENVTQLWMDYSMM